MKRNLEIEKEIRRAILGVLSGIEGKRINLGTVISDWIKRTIRIETDYSSIMQALALAITEKTGVQLTPEDLEEKTLRKLAEKIAEIKTEKGETNA